MKNYAPYTYTSDIHDTTVDYNKKFVQMVKVTNMYDDKGGWSIEKLGLA